MRLLHILVIGALVAAAAYVYEIKFESTLQAERLAKLRLEIRKERDAIATLARRMGETRQSDADAGADAAASQAQARGRHPDRLFRQAAGPAGRGGAAGQSTIRSARSSKRKTRPKCRPAA